MRIVGNSRTSSRGAQVYTGDTLEQLSKALTDMKARVSSIGKHVKTMPLRDPANRDYRPIADSGAKDMGVKFFVPWGLSRMVGEWNFYKSPYAPKIVLGENFYMQDEHMHRSMYYFVPRHDLTVNQADPEDYVEGPLEDWIPGALRFDGKSRFAVLTHKEMSRDMTYPYGVGASGRVRSGRSVFKGADRETLDMSDNNFLVEIYFRADKDHTDGGLVGKTDGRSGYALGFDSAGRIVLTVQAAGHMGGRIAGPKLADGKWHHVIAEVDRKASVDQSSLPVGISRHTNCPVPFGRPRRPTSIRGI